jgi:glycosyltransferase involved in cell wall biosynthesis
MESAPSPSTAPLRIAYLVNQYPHVSHSFIRREIVALEAQGVTVHRFSIRPSREKLVDPGDEEERRRTRVVLDVGFLGLIRGMMGAALTNTAAFLSALGLAIRLGRRSERGVLRHLAYLAEAAVLLPWLRAADVSHVHAHFGTNPAAVALLLKVLGGPSYSFTIHGPEEFDHPRDLSLAEKILHASGVVAVSSFGRGQIYRWIPYTEWHKVHVVHCGVDAAFLAAGPQPVVDNRRLICVGRLTEQKGQLLLLEAMAMLAKEQISFELVLAGDGPLRVAIERRIKELNLGSNVRITGWLSNDEVRKELLQSRALILPSFAEGLPVVLMEALALGRASLSTYVAGIPELIQDGVSGWLISAGSVSAAAEGIRRVLATPIATLTQMGAAGASAVSAQHDARHEAALLVDMFRRATAGNGVAAPS